MEYKIVFLLFLLQQFCHLALPHSMVNDLSQQNESNETIFNVQSVADSQTNFPIQIGNKFYHVESTLEVNWFEAAHTCRQLGGHLLNLESSKEMDAILSIVPTARYWISGNCLAKDRDWISITTGEAMPYFRWDDKEPNNSGGKEFCVEIKRTALNDDACTKKLHYICEAKII